ncbi:hypothetical protein BDA99DRAFT_534496 [Phascolomyces articulosus]|uniref:Uncharacterized protein n=1 Tax=Phascolomyces articulosus TaxID=60185 RepID=A0AAD5K5B4_9FUNG|nr:hypothetical protein BDA99DRAFT_534496 [Phascolomyces articulosus]
MISKKWLMSLKENSNLFQALTRHIQTNSTETYGNLSRQEYFYLKVNCKPLADWDELVDALKTGYEFKFDTMISKNLQSYCCTASNITVSTLEQDTKYPTFRSMMLKVITTHANPAEGEIWLEFLDGDHATIKRQFDRIHKSPATDRNKNLWYLPQFQSTMNNKDNVNMDYKNVTANNTVTKQNVDKS